MSQLMSKRNKPLTSTPQNTQQLKEGSWSTHREHMQTQGEHAGKTSLILFPLINAAICKLR